MGAARPVWRENADEATASSRSGEPLTISNPARNAADVLLYPAALRRRKICLRVSK